MEKFEINYVLLKQCMKERQITQTKLEAISGINRKTISNVLNGKHTPSFDVANQLIVYLELTEEEVRRIFLPGLLALEKRKE